MNAATTPEIPADSTRVRASSLPAAFDCAFRWEGEQLLGMRMPSGPPALLGQALHHGTAVYDLALMQGRPISVGDGAGAVVQMVRAPEFDVDWRGSDWRPKQVEAVALDLYTRYCTSWAGKVRYEAVELTIKPLTIDCGGGVKITLTGTLDRSRVLRSSAELLRVRDLKSGKTAVVYDEALHVHRAATKKHRAQLGVYELLSEHSLGRPVDTTSEVLGLSTAGSRPIAEGEVHGGRALLLGTQHGPPGLLELLADNLRAGRFPPNPSSPLCHKRYCARWATCPYHE